MARIENWRIVVGSLAGQIYDHPYYRDGMPIQTSPVLGRVEPKQVRTRNSVYELGQPDPWFVSDLAIQGMSADQALERVLVS